MKRKLKILLTMLLCIVIVICTMNSMVFAVQGVGLNKDKVTLSIGESVTLKLNGSSIKSAKSSNKKVASVNNKGKVTGKKKGKVTITVLGKNNKKYKCKVIIKGSKNAAYKHILSEYRDAFKVDYESFMEDDYYYYNLYPDVIQIVYWYEYMYKTFGRELKYAYYDIDGNGTDELVLGFDSGAIIDIYANKNGKAKKLFDDDKLGEKSGLDIYNNGIIRYSYVVYGPNSGDGAGEGITYYKLAKNGYRLKKVKKPNKRKKAKMRWKSLL